MQRTGTLGKRRRRNLAKVNGLGTVPYNETMDNFTGRDVFGDSSSSPREKPFSIVDGFETRLNFSAEGMQEYRRESGGIPISRNRVTRNPNFHRDTGSADSQDFRVENETRNIFSPFSNNSKSMEDRSRLLDKYAVQRLKQIILLGATSGAFPWKWNANQWSIDKWSTKWETIWKVLYSFFSVQICFICGFQMYTYYNVVKVERTHHREMFMNTMGLLWYLWGVSFNLNMYIYRDKIRQYINTMLDFNKNYVEKYLIHLDGYQMGGRVAVNIATLTNMAQVVVTVCLYFIMPFMPWFLTSYIYPIPWYCLIPGMIQEYTIAGQVITSYILLSWIVVAHTNTVQFWLKEIHNNNDSDFTIDELRHPKTSIETYKALLILNQCFNECMAPLAVPLLKFHMMSGMIVCGYILVRSMNHVFIDEFPAILSYPVGVWNCSTGGFAIMTMASQVFDLGCSCIDSWSQTKQKDFRRILMSCPTFKIWTARFYFITVATTLTFFKIIFDVITDLIIAFP